MSACLSLNPHACFIFPFLLHQVFQVLSAITHFVCSSRLCVARTHVYKCTAVSKVFSTEVKQVSRKMYRFIFFKSPIHIQSVANVILSSGMSEGHANCCSDPFIF